MHLLALKALSIALGANALIFIMGQFTHNIISMNGMAEPMEALCKDYLCQTYNLYLSSVYQVIINTLNVFFACLFAQIFYRLIKNCINS
jgi:hypothetical protein